VINKNPRKKFALLFASLMSLSALIGSAPIARAEDGCGFGFRSSSVQDLSDPDYIKSIPDPYAYFEGEEIHCYKVKWSDADRNDGFSKLIGISINADRNDDDFGNAYDLVTIFCVKKKFEVYVYVDYAYSVGWSGAGQIRFDNQSAKNMPYILSRSLQSVRIRDSAGFVRNFAKAKKKVTLKINTTEYTKILAYPKSDLLSYRAKFKKAGCVY
jgi:hypothetical protein